MARGAPGAHALDMQKYFDTNYHYLVPELDADATPAADWSGLVDKARRGQAVLGAERAVPILVGPVTLVRLARLGAGADPSALVDALLPAYVDALRQLKELGVPEVQVRVWARGRGDSQEKVSATGFPGKGSGQERDLGRAGPSRADFVIRKGTLGEQQGTGCSLSLPTRARVRSRPAKKFDDWPTGKALPKGE